MNNQTNLVLSGGGVKGIAFIGALEAFDMRRWSFHNIAGVSAGALLGSILAAGYRSYELRGLLDSLDFGKIKAEQLVARVPLIMQYKNLCNGIRNGEQQDEFLTHLKSNMKHAVYGSYGPDCAKMRSSLLTGILKFCKQGCLFDGDYLEEWISGILSRRGIRTFGDLRGGIRDKVNPGGYKIRMSTVDATRGRLIVLPDDIAYYGINPDSLEVAKAVRMSTSVPFVFKPVVLSAVHDGAVKSYSFIDGGVFDSFPFWMLENHDRHTADTRREYLPVTGMRLLGGRKSLIGLDTPFVILKNLLSMIQDIGVPNNTVFNQRNLVKIYTSGVSFLDFNLKQQQMEYLINCGRDAANMFFTGQREVYTGSMHYQALLLLLLIFLGMGLEEGKYVERRP